MYHGQNSGQVGCTIANTLKEETQHISRRYRPYSNAHFLHIIPPRNKNYFYLLYFFLLANNTFKYIFNDSKNYYFKNNINEWLRPIFIPIVNIYHILDKIMTLERQRYYSVFYCSQTLKQIKYTFFNSPLDLAQLGIFL